jgi:hypothetical protein
MSSSEVRADISRVRVEFIEMPGLRLTLPQASACGNWSLRPAAI